MATLAKHLVMCHTQVATSHKSPNSEGSSDIRSSSSSTDGKLSRRRSIISTLLAASATVGLQAAPIALAQSWGTKSMLKERYFEPGLSPEESVARIKNTAEGLRAMREMLDTMSWRYCIFYIRLKSSYLNSDLKNALSTLPESRRSSFVKTANELVDNMAELDYYVRNPKVYESYVYYEKTLKSLDELVALMA